MKLTYGPPGHKGVSQLMAVGADEYATSTDVAVQQGTAIAAGTFVVGLVASSPLLRTLGAGATLALLAVRLAAKRRPGGQSSGGGAGTSF